MVNEEAPQTIDYFDYIYKLAWLAFAVKAFKELTKDEKARANFIKNITKIAKFIAEHPKACILHPAVAWAGWEAWKGLGWAQGLGGALSAMIALEIATGTSSEIAGTAALAYLAGIGFKVGLWPFVIEALKNMFSEAGGPPPAPLIRPHFLFRQT